MYLPSHSYGLWNSKLSSARTLRIKRPQTLKHKALSLVGESFSFFFLCKYYLDFFKGQRTCQFIEVTPWLEIMNFEEHGLDFSTQLDCRPAGHGWDTLDMNLGSGSANWEDKYDTSVCRRKMYQERINILGIWIIQQEMNIWYEYPVSWNVSFKRAETFVHWYIQVSRTLPGTWEVLKKHVLNIQVI